MSTFLHFTFLLPFLSIPLDVYVIFYDFKENRQPEDVDEELTPLETEVIGEIHIISFLGKLTKL